MPPKPSVTVQIRNPLRDIPHYLGVFQIYLGGRMYLVFALTLVAALAEGVGLLMLLPLLQGLGGSGLGQAGQAPLAEGGSHSSGIALWLNELLASLGLADSTLAVLLIITAAFIVKGIITFGALGYAAYLRGKLLREVKGRLFEHYSRMSYAYYASRDTGHFINLINAQINLMLAAFGALSQLGAKLINTLIYLALAFLVAWRFGLMALLLGIVLLMLFRWLNVSVRQLSRKAAQENGRLAKYLIQTLHAFKYLTATGQMPKLKRSITASISRLTGYEMRRGIADAFTRSVSEPIAVVFIMLIVMAQLLYFQQPLAPILVSIVLFYRAINSILSMQQNWQGTLDHIGSLELLHNEFTNLQQHQTADGERHLGPFSQGIQLKNLHFSYAPKLGHVLQDISLHIPAQSAVALVGESGAGKSTLVDLLSLTLKPSHGQILIDGIPGDQIQTTSWRQQIGYVSQETVVFDDSIANNICLWQGDPSQDPALLGQIQAAARQAHIAHFIETLPEGYHSLVGDRGVRLSGGQRQRLFIARELFRQPRLLILDEATSALDSESEQAIQQSIDALKGKITLVIIAHRLSTIRDVDRIYVFDQGHLYEQGSYEELRARPDSRFAKLVALQKL
ncbi:ABC transporter ATP-binding protein [Magnetovirga frankeli]|uniref:ABC transporter ATP-binding protein n=1 Tax=Magnetovirga frankeli TaxID=947516 RepID=UPI0012930FFD|nr:ABC transporter ATP-binding protein [gamma proteobacterium SS-5]